MLPERPKKIPSVEFIVLTRLVPQFMDPGSVAPLKVTKLPELPFNLPFNFPSNNQTFPQWSFICRVKDTSEMTPKSVVQVSPGNSAMLEVVDTFAPVPVSAAGVKVKPDKPFRSVYSGFPVVDEIHVANAPVSPEKDTPHTLPVPYCGQ